MKRFSKIILAVAAVALAVFFVIRSVTAAALDCFEANVEALADDEGGDSRIVDCFGTYYDSGASGYYLQIRDCKDCSIVTAEYCSDSGKCRK